MFSLFAFRENKKERKKREKRQCKRHGRKEKKKTKESSEQFNKDVDAIVNSIQKSERNRAERIKIPEDDKKKMNIKKGSEGNNREKTIKSMHYIKKNKFLIRVAKKVTTKTDFKNRNSGVLRQEEGG